MERIKKITCWLLATAMATAVVAQNSAIFKGGTADGWSSQNRIQSSSSICKGGGGDGWSSLNFAQASSSIFKGGEGDGWSSLNIVQSSVSIFKGGFGDGWDSKKYIQANSGIFKGGGGDGWASTYRPLGALPVTLLSFTAEKQAKASLLKWQTSKEEGSDHFDVERSLDALSFVRIGAVAATGNSSATSSYSFTDPQPLKGYNYYRLKQVDKSGAFVYTPVRLVMFDAMTLTIFKAYPVPVTALLTIELPTQIQSENVVINVSNAVGVMVQQIKLSGNRADNRKVLNLTTLPAGTYVVQVSSAGFNGSQVIIKQ